MWLSGRRGAGQRTFWALAFGAVTAALLAGGGLVALQTMNVISGVPFALLMLVLMVALPRMLERAAPGRGA